MSRLMTFVLAAAVGAALALVLAISNMFPLDRTQVFLLNSSRPENRTIELQPLNISASTLDVYKESFIREYVRTRNEILANPDVMRLKWRSGGQLYLWSKPEVFAAFRQTQMYTAFMSGLNPGVPFKCPVEFKRIEPRTATTWTVRFSYFCTSDNAGQIDGKDYTIIIGLTMDASINYSERLANPLGLRVSEYTVIEGGADPLDFMR